MTHSYKLTFMTPHYNVVTNENNDKVTICELSCTMILPVPFTQKIKNKYSEKVEFDFMPHYSCNIIPTIAIITVDGSALCHGDKFDFSVGKHLSETRAKKKAYDLAKRILIDLREEYTLDTVSERDGKTVARLSPINQICASIKLLNGYLVDEEKHLEKLKSL